MNSKNSANEKPAHGCNHERVAETAALAGITFSNPDYTTSGNERQPGYVEALLFHGEANAIPTAQLVELTGFRNARTLQKQIELERRHGALILSRSGYGGGYFLPCDGEAGQREIADYVRTLRARALNTLRTLKSARDALSIIDGQERMML